jgi:hypothetical protein
MLRGTSCFESLGMTIYFVPIHNAVSRFPAFRLHLAAIKVRHFVTRQADGLTVRRRVNENLPGPSRHAIHRALFQPTCGYSLPGKIYLKCYSNKSNWTSWTR